MAAAVPRSLVCCPCSVTKCMLINRFHSRPFLSFLFSFSAVAPPTLLPTTPTSSSFSLSKLFFNISFPTRSSPAHIRRFSSSYNTNNPASFNFSDSDDDGDDSPKTKTKTIDKSKLPPPYDPFSKKPVIEEPEDAKNLQEIFHNMRTEGLIPNAIKMFDALSKDGLTHEAMELFAQIKDKGNMPDVVAHTAVLEAYANAGQSREALKVFMRMLASGVKPNAYTYAVLIKGLVKDGKIGDVKKYLLEMMDRGIRPNVGTYTTVFEAFAKEQKVDEGREFLEQMKAKGFVPDEKAVREHLAKRGQRKKGIRGARTENKTRKEEKTVKPASSNKLKAVNKARTTCKLKQVKSCEQNRYNPQTQTSQKL